MIKAKPKFLFSTHFGLLVKKNSSPISSPKRYNFVKNISHQMSSIQVVQTDKAPQALGPYSQAIKANGLIFCSGQIPIVPEDGSIPEDITAQTNQVLKNLKQVLVAAGADLSSVVKTNVFLKDMNDFAAMNTVYEQHFGSHRPARAAVEVARLPKDVKVEIECTAVSN